MSCLQASLCWSSANGNRISLPQSCNLRSAVPVLPSRSKWPRSDRGGSRRRRGTPVCLFGGKGDAKDDRDASPWKSLEKAMGNFGKERSLQDVLREQMKQQEVGGDGGSGKPPDGGDEGDDYDDSEEYPEESPFREFINEFLAFIGFITLAQPCRFCLGIRFLIRRLGIPAFVFWMRDENEFQGEDSKCTTTLRHISTCSEVTI